MCPGKIVKVQGIGNYVQGSIILGWQVCHCSNLAALVAKDRPLLSNFISAGVSSYVLRLCTAFMVAVSLNDGLRLKKGFVGLHSEVKLRDWLMIGLGLGISVFSVLRTYFFFFCSFFLS